MDFAPGKRCILVVEDDLATREGLARILESDGHTAIGAANGQEALRMLRDGLRPDLILLDLMMPVMDGWQFRQQQRQDPDFSGIPVVIVSAVGNLEQTGTSLGVSTLLQKPVDIDQMLEVVHRFASREKPMVLVVDDESQVRAMLQVALEHYGFTVLTAADGREAIELYRRNRDRIGSVLLDVQMSDLDGPATLAALRQINPDVPCCFMSGHTGKYSRDTLLALGAARIFQKPFGLAEVAQTLRKFLKKNPEVESGRSS